MAERRAARPALFTIPAHRAFADSLAAGLIARHGGEPLTLARGMILTPNDRSRRALRDAFVRASGGALLLPRLVSLGDPDMGEGTGIALDAVEQDVPPAVPPLKRRMILARLVADARAIGGQPVDAAEAVRLAGEVARVLDQLLVEGITPQQLAGIDPGGELTEHWQRSLELFRVVQQRWPGELDRLGMIDAADRRNRLLRQLADRWREQPPAGFVCAAGVTDSAPAVAALLRAVAFLPQGSVVFADLDTAMPDDQWDALGPFDRDESGRRKPALETHPQFHLKLLLDRIGFARKEVRAWREEAGPDAGTARGRAIATALAAPMFTASWSTLHASKRRLEGITAAELATPAEEAQAIALALREVLETPGATAALVTPDRGLARRVAAHLRRWGVGVDDSAGRPLAMLPPGTLLAALVEAATQRFAPLALLTLLKHPLVRSGDERGRWLDGVRSLDLTLRGPRPSVGLAGIAAHLAQPDERRERLFAQARTWWPEALALLQPLEQAFAGGRPLGELLRVIRETAQALCGDALWSGPAGRAAAELIAELEEQAGEAPPLDDPATLGPLLDGLMQEVAVRPQGGHPRLAIYGLIEGRLQSADRIILGGLNEGVWPPASQADPFLAPRIRAELELPGLERRIGVAAHDFAAALGAPRALITRARRDASGPAVASRLWLRLRALAGEQFAVNADLEHWTRAIDDPGEHVPEPKPEPMPPAELRPDRIAVTDLDRLKADPYAFYAKKILKLMPLDAVDAEPSAAWRGTAVHKVLQDWADAGAEPDQLRERALALFTGDVHPLIAALWQPRLMEAIDWIVAESAEQFAAGRTILKTEIGGETMIEGVLLHGKADRIDRMPDGTLGIIDYKTGSPPSMAAIREGFSLQLGLLGLIAERGGFADLTGHARGFEYWSLSRKNGSFGFIDSPTDRKRDPIEPEDFVAMAERHVTAAIRDWLTGTEPFTAKLHPEFAPYAEYDQLMRRDEWYGRG